MTPIVIFDVNGIRAEKPACGIEFNNHYAIYIHCDYGNSCKIELLRGVKCDPCNITLKTLQSVKEKINNAISIYEANLSDDFELTVVINYDKQIVKIMLNDNELFYEMMYSYGTPIYNLWVNKNYLENKENPVKQSEQGYPDPIDSSVTEEIKSKPYKLDSDLEKELLDTQRVCRKLAKLNNLLIEKYIMKRGINLSSYFF